DWFADEWLDADESTRRATLATLDDQAARRPPGAGGISFLPYLGGQLSPVRRPWASATFHGLTTRSARIDMFRAVIEGVSFAAAEVFQQIKSWVGEPTALGMTGSGARSPLWRQMLADILRYPIEVTDAASEGRGAAIFCAVALGYYPTLSDAVANMVHRTAVIEPTNTNLYADAYERWRHVRDALAEIDKT
ncbi:MAG: hypothetical protein KDI19_14160, partial [Pseudomonadales bacterium]|nr:hypothetical protein [Pseudomonadales bacterium]